MLFERKAFKTPQNLTEAAELVARLKDLDTQIEQIRLDQLEASRKLNGEFWERSLPLIHERDELVKVLESYASSHRDELTTTKKSVKVPCGTFGWRKGSVCSEVENEEALIAELESRGLDKYITTKKTINRSLLLADRRRLDRMKIPGLKFTRGERFYVKINKPLVEPEKPEERPTEVEVALSPS